MDIRSLPKQDLPEHTLVQYLRKGKDSSRPHAFYGVLVAIKNPSDTGYRIGYSLCCSRDYFDKNDALDRAMGRAERSKYSDGIPHSIQRHLPEFMERCDRYYKAKYSGPQIRVAPHKSDRPAFFDGFKHLVDAGRIEMLDDMTMAHDRLNRSAIRVPGFE